MGGICQSEAGGICSRDGQGPGRGSAAGAGGDAAWSAAVHAEQPPVAMSPGGLPPLSSHGLLASPPRGPYSPHFAAQPFGFQPKAKPNGRHVGDFPGAEAYYTVRLLVVPLGALFAAGTMTVLNTVWDLEAAPVCLFFSDVLNDPKKEPWMAWALRWFLCFWGISSHIEFKRTYLPQQVHWVLLLQWVAFLVAMLTGFRQLDPPHAIYLVMYKVHQLAAMIMFVEIWLETIMLWCPSRILHAVFLFIVPVNIITFAISGWVNIETGIPYIYGHPEIVLEWFIILAHFAVVWARFPAVSAAVADGTWRPWVCCFAGMCPDLVTQREQVQWGCPPGLLDEEALVMVAPLQSFSDGMQAGRQGAQASRFAPARPVSPRAV